MEKSYHCPFITSPIKGITIKAKTKKIWHSKAFKKKKRISSYLNLAEFIYPKTKEGVS